MQYSVRLRLPLSNKIILLCIGRSIGGGISIPKVAERSIQAIFEGLVGIPTVHQAYGMQEGEANGSAGFRISSALVPRSAWLCYTSASLSFALAKQSLIYKILYI